MASGEFEVIVVGDGAAGIAAARYLYDAGVQCLLVEARERLGGRAWTVIHRHGFGLDLGCGWLHSADRNPWVAIAEAQGRSIDKTPPPWMRPAVAHGFPAAEQAAFHEAFDAFFERVNAATVNADCAASTRDGGTAGRPPAFARHERHRSANARTRGRIMAGSRQSGRR